MLTACRIGTSRRRPDLVVSRRITTISFAREVAQMRVASISDAGIRKGKARSSVWRRRPDPRRSKYVGRIFKWTKPAGPPVDQPIKFEVVVNMKPAKSLELALPQSFPMRENKLIE
jgi:hypothetical protein